MVFESFLMIVYAVVSFAIAALAIYILFRERNWPQQLFAVIVFVPFVLRALGIK